MAKKEEFINVEEIIEATRDATTPTEMVEKGYAVATGDQNPTQTFFEALWEFLTQFGKK